jgi:hypothetical protein
MSKRLFSNFASLFLIGLAANVFAQKAAFSTLSKTDARAPKAEKAPKIRLSEKDFTKIALLEDSMKAPALTMLLDTLTRDSSAMRGERQAQLDTISQQWRVGAGEKLGRMMRSALRVRHSFDYDFKNVPQISVLYDEKRTFRIMTWQVFVNSMDFKYFGVVQFENGKTVFLQDKKKTLKTPLNKKLKADNWYGALYYTLKTYKYKGKTQYMAVGYDADAFFSHSKIVEPINIEGTSVSFGAPIFELRSEEQRKMDEQADARNAKNPALMIKPNPPHRFILDYAAEAAVSLRYDEEMKMFTFDHVVPMGSTKYGVKNMPDGDVDGLKLKNGKWELQERLFKDISPEVPRPMPVLDGRKDGLFGTQSRP